MTTFLHSYLNCSNHIKMKISSALLTAIQIVHSVVTFTKWDNEIQNTQPDFFNLILQSCASVSCYYKFWCTCTSFAVTIINISLKSLADDGTPLNYKEQCCMKEHL